MSVRFDSSTMLAKISKKETAVSILATSRPIGHRLFECPILTLALRHVVFLHLNSSPTVDALLPELGLWNVTRGSVRVVQSRKWGEIRCKFSDVYCQKFKAAEGISLSLKKKNLFPFYFRVLDMHEFITPGNVGHIMSSLLLVKRSDFWMHLDTNNKYNKKHTKYIWSCVSDVTLQWKEGHTSRTEGNSCSQILFSPFFCPQAKQLKPYLPFYSLLSHCHYLLARDSESFNSSCPSPLCCLLILHVPLGAAEASFFSQPPNTHTHTHSLSPKSLAASWPTHTAACWSS